MTLSLWTEQARGSWPRGAGGFVFLAQAVDLIGHHLFGADWKVSDLDTKLMFPRQTPRQYVPRSIAGDDFAVPRQSRADFEAAALQEFVEHNAAAIEHNRVNGKSFERARTVKQAIVNQASVGRLPLLYRRETDGSLHVTPDTFWTLSTAFAAFRACCILDQTWMPDEDRTHPVYLFVQDADLRAIDWKAVVWRQEPAPLSSPACSPATDRLQPSAPARPAVQWTEHEMTAAIKQWVQDNSSRDRDVAWRNHFKALVTEHGWTNQNFRDHWSAALGSAGQPGRPKPAQ